MPSAAAKILLPLLAPLLLTLASCTAAAQPNVPLVCKIHVFLSEGPDDYWSEDYRGVGQTESAAYDAAVARCESSNFHNDARALACEKNVRKRGCDRGGECISRRDIRSTGYNTYKGGGRNDWCLSVGYDRYDDSAETGGREYGDCVRDCPSLCVKVAVRELGYTNRPGGHKTLFCDDRGYDGASDYFGGEAGYCYIGPHTDCALPHRDPPKADPELPRNIRNEPGCPGAVC